MVETSTKSVLPSQRASHRTSHSSSTATRQGSGVVHIPRLVLPRDHDNSNHIKKESQSRSRGLSQARSKRGEAATIFTLIGCAGAICALGVFYVSAYARVAKQEREIHSLQVDVSVAQAHHQVLVQDLARLQSAKRIDTLATQMNMVHVGTSDYIGGSEHTPAFAENPAPIVNPTQMASAR